jgi:hypothetical protein
MKQLVLALMVAGVVPFAAAQAPAQGQNGPAMAWPKPTVNAKEAHVMRLDILNAERSEINKKLSEAMVALPNSKDMQVSLQGVSRLQTDLMAIDREIANVEGRNRKGAAPNEARKPVAQVAGSETTAQGQLAEAAHANTEFEAWDVFKNFGKKGN